MTADRPDSQRMVDNSEPSFNSRATAPTHPPLAVGRGSSPTVREGSRTHWLVTQGTSGGTNFIGPYPEFWSKHRTLSPSLFVANLF